MKKILVLIIILFMFISCSSYVVRVNVLQGNSKIKNIKIVRPFSTIDDDNEKEIEKNFDNYRFKYDIIIKTDKEYILINLKDEK